MVTLSTVPEASVNQTRNGIWWNDAGPDDFALRHDIVVEFGHLVSAGQGETSS